MSDRELYGFVVPKSPDSVSWTKWGYEREITVLECDSAMQNVEFPNWNLPPLDALEMQNAQFENAFQVAKSRREQCQPTMENGVREMKIRLYNLAMPPNVTIDNYYMSAELANQDLATIRKAESFKQTSQGANTVRLKISKNGKVKNWNGRLYYVGNGKYTVVSKSKNRPEKVFHWKQVIDGPTWNPDIKMWSIKIEA